VTVELPSVALLADVDTPDDYATFQP
jgi:hypothetical protein